MIELKTNMTMRSRVPQNQNSTRFGRNQIYATYGMYIVMKTLCLHKSYDTLHLLHTRTPHFLEELLDPSSKENKQRLDLKDVMRREGKDVSNTILETILVS